MTRLERGRVRHILVFRCQYLYAVQNHRRRRAGGRENCQHAREFNALCRAVCLLLSVAACSSENTEGLEERIVLPGIDSMTTKGRPRADLLEDHQRIAAQIPSEARTHPLRKKMP